MIGTDTITMYKGTDLTLPFTMNPVEDISGWTILLTVRGSSVSIIKDATIDSGPDGTFHFTLADTDTDSLSPGTYDYDVFRTDSGVEEVLAIGAFVIQTVARDVS